MQYLILLKYFTEMYITLATCLSILKINLDEIQPHVIALSEHNMSKDEIVGLIIQNYSISSL